MKCKSKSQWDYQFILIRMAITKMTKNNKCWQVCVEKTILIHCRWLRKLVYPYGKQEISQKMLNRTTTGSSNSTLGYIFKKKSKTLIGKDTCTPMFTAALFTLAKVWKQSKCPSTEKWIQKMWYTHIHTHNGISLSRKKKNEILPFATTWMDM